jgi:hypothetical protein
MLRRTPGEPGYNNDGGRASAGATTNRDRPSRDRPLAALSTDEAETNGCVQRFIQALKGQVLWIEGFDTLDQLRNACAPSNDFTSTGCSNATATAAPRSAGQSSRRPWHDLPRSPTNCQVDRGTRTGED